MKKSELKQLIKEQIKSLLVEDEKDKDRVKDLFAKSKGSDEKLLQLATNMAKAITDPVKAYNRGKAADDLIGPDDNKLADVFYDRAKELGYDVKGENPKYDRATNQKGIIYLPTWSAISLWKHELCGQFSDGRWENSGNDRKWKFWTGLEVKKGVPETHVAYGRMGGYNVSDAELLYVVGDRMIANGRFAKAIGKDSDLGEWLEGINTPEEFEKLKSGSKEWAKKYLDKISDEDLKKYFATKYDKSDMMTDLRLIKKAMTTFKD